MKDSLEGYFHRLVDGKFEQGYPTASSIVSEWFLTHNCENCVNSTKGEYDHFVCDKLEKTFSRVFFCRLWVEKPPCKHELVVDGNVSEEFPSVVKLKCKKCGKWMEYTHG